MANLFISYSRKDKETVSKLTEALKSQDLDFWIDWEGIEPTVDWWREIEKGIEGADNFLFLISPDSSSSPVCRREIEHAVKNGKRLIPVVVRDIRAEESPAQLRHLNWVFLRETDDFQTAFGKLVRAVKTDYVWVAFHRRLQVRALEWDRASHENSLLLRGKDLQAAEAELAVNSSKEPHPTDLQRNYVLKSRQASDRQRRLLVSVAIGVAIVMTVLAVFGFVQAKLATERANIALARQLAAQAKPIWETGDSRQEIAVLLAVRSMQIFPVVDSAQVLQNTTLARIIASVTQPGEVDALTFSPDGKYVASGSEFGTARVWEAMTGKEVARINHDYYYVTSLDFSPDGRYVVSGGGNTARVWEAMTGKEVARMTYENSVHSVAFSPDGKHVVSGGCSELDADGLCEKGPARVWEAMTGKEIASVTHDSDVSAIAFSPDGKYVVSGGDNTARVWEAMTGKEIARMTYDNSVHSVAFSPDGRYVASGGGNTARVWQAMTGKEVASVTHDSDVSSITFSPDGKYILSQSGTFTVHVWEAMTGKEVTHTTYADYVRSVAFSPDGKYVASGIADGTARVWETMTGKEVARTTFASDVSSIAFSPDGKYVVSGGCLEEGLFCEKSAARVWEAVAGKEVARLTYEGAVSLVAFSLDGKYVASGGCEGKNSSRDCSKSTARVWETTTGKEIARMAYEGAVSSLAFSPDGQYVASGGCDERNPSNRCSKSTTRVWETMTGSEIVRLTYHGEVSSVAFSPDGRYVVSGGCDQADRVGCVRGIGHVWEIATGTEVARMTYEDMVWSVAFSPDGKYVVSGGCDESDPTNRCTKGTARVWEAMTGKEIARMTHEGTVYSVAFSPDGKYVVSGGCDERKISRRCSKGTARLWETMTGKEIARLTYDGAVSSAAFSPDGRYVVSGGCSELDAIDVCERGVARVWEAMTGKEVTSMIHEDPVSSVAFSPDGNYVISGGDNTARVWEAMTGKEIASTTHADTVWSVAFSPDGKHVVSGGGDGVVRVWIYRAEDLIANACSRVHRNLTNAEWLEYFGEAVPYQVICPDLPSDLILLIDVAEQALSDIQDPNRVQTAINKVSNSLNENSNSDHAAAQAQQIVTDIIEMEIANISAAVADGAIESAFNSIDNAKKIGLEIEDAEKLNSICWFGSIYRYAKEVLAYCEQAVALAPDHEAIRDSRGLARALTGDYSGAIEDFQFFIENSDDEIYIEQRQQWIVDLSAGKNPITPEVLEELKNQQVTMNLILSAVALPKKKRESSKQTSG